MNDNEDFEFIVGEWVQVNPDNSRAMSALTYFLLLKFWVSQSHDVITVVCWICATAIKPGTH